MHHFFTTCGLVCFSFFLTCTAHQTLLFAEVIPADRIVDWSQAGIPGDIPVYPAGVNVMNYGALGDGMTDDTLAIQNAINACPTGSAVYLPNGAYRLTSTLNINRSIALRGESRLGTILQMDHLTNGISILTYSGTASAVDIVSGLTKGSTTIEMASSNSHFVTGALLELTQDNDPDLYQIGEHGIEPWTDRQTGMINEITAVNGTTLTLKFPLFFDYDASYNPTGKIRGRVTGAGIENLTVDRIINTTGTGTNILLYAAKQCWVKNVWSERAYNDHIRISRSVQCNIRGNVLNDTWMDAGGQGYGITLEDRSTHILVEDNSMSHLRHSLIVQGGATGNVFAYNFSRDPYSNDSPNWIFADICAHGSMANFNLWEGTKAVQAYVDNIHGSNPWITVFRNYLTKPNANHFGIGVRKTSKWCNVVGNVIGNTGTAGQIIDVDQEVTEHTLVSGNYNGITGEILWDNNNDTTLPASLYLTSKPAFFNSKPWPMYGPDAGVASTLPAEDRWYTLSGTTPPTESPIANTVVVLPEPVVYYDCKNDGTGLLTDLSINALNGVLNGPTYISNSYNNSTALLHDGTDDTVVIADTSVLDMTSSITLACWVNLNSTTADQCIVGKNSAYYLLVDSNNRLALGLPVNGAWVLFRTSNSSIPRNEWAHLVATYDDTKARLYLNGIQLQEWTSTGNINASNKDLIIGSIWGGRYIDGLIDDLAIFSQALNASQVHALYTGNMLLPVQSISLLNYGFEEGSGSIAIDSSPSNFDSNITSATHTTNAVDGSYALNFDGIDDKVVIADMNELDLTETITMAAWVKTTDITKNQCIMGKNTAYFFTLLGNTTAAKIRLGLRIGSSWVTATSSPIISPNTWTHITASYDSSSIKLYVDGLEVTSKSQTGLISTSNKDLEIGSIWNGWYFIGAMDNVQLYDFTLTNEEIASLSN